MPSASGHPQSTLKAILFDIGRVIVRLDVNRGVELLARKANGAGNSPKLSGEEIWKQMQSEPRWLDWQEGRLTAQQWHEHVMRRLHISLSFEDFCAAWNAVLDPKPMLSENLFVQLASRVRLGVLSNTDAIHVECLENYFSFLRYFPVRIYSNEIGASKPSPEIYRAALIRLSVGPAEALYIDDIAEYAQAARSLGMDAIHFENPEQLVRDLSRRGLIAD